MFSIKKKVINNIFLLICQVYVLGNYYYHATIDFWKQLFRVEKIRKLHRSFYTGNLCTNGRGSNVLLIVIYRIAFLDIVAYIMHFNILKIFLIFRFYCI